MSNNSAINWILAQSWAMQTESLLLMLAIAGRNNDQLEANAQILAARSEQENKHLSMLTAGAKPIEGTNSAMRREGVGIIHVSGPIFRYASNFSNISSATSIAQIASDYEKLKYDKSIHSIAFDGHSPGGDITGINQFADDLFSLRNSKTLAMYVSGLACSAMYWIGSAVSPGWIYADASANIGSIGVIGAMSGGADNYEIISSQSPYKRLDYNNKSHRARVQQKIDATADIFINSVARNRGVSRDFVLANFGKGDYMIAEKALKSKMIDRIGSMEEMINNLEANHTSPFVPAKQSLPKNNSSKRPAKPRLVADVRPMTDNLTSNRACGSLGSSNRGKQMNFNSIFGRNNAQQANSPANAANGFLAQLGLNQQADADTPALPTAGNVLLQDGTEVALADIFDYAQTALSGGGQLAIQQQQQPLQQAGGLVGNERAELDRLRAERQQQAITGNQAAAQAANLTGKNIARQLLNDGKIQPTAQEAVATAFARLAYLPAVAGLPANYDTIAFNTVGANGQIQNGSCSIVELFAAIIDAKPTLALGQEIVQQPATVTALFNKPTTANTQTAGGSVTNDRIASMVAMATGKSIAQVTEAVNARNPNG